MAIVPSDIPTGALNVAREAAEAAGRMAIAYFRHGSQTTAGIDYKHGGSPVTEADLLVDLYLRERLMTAAPDFGWLSEETADAPARLKKRNVWVVDPIDGTKSFARGDPDWTIAVGLVRDGVPLAGFVYAPVSDEMFEATPGRPALLNGHPIQVSSCASLDKARIAGPRPVLDAIQGSGARFDAPRAFIPWRFVSCASRTAPLTGALPRTDRTTGIWWRRTPSSMRPGEAS